VNPERQGGHGPLAGGICRVGLDGGEDVEGRLRESLQKRLSNPHSLGHDGTVSIDGHGIDRLDFLSFRTDATVAEAVQLIRQLAPKRYPASYAYEVDDQDFQRMFGAGGDERSFSPIRYSLQQRLPWLYVNLATAFLAAAVVAMFEGIIAKLTVLAVAYETGV
jgi:hypothetical protein